MISENRKVANEKDLKEGGLLRVELDGTPIVLAKVNGSIYAVDATCTHQGGPLDEGKLEGHDLTCPWHYAVFDVRNGKVSDKTVWATNLNSYTVQVDKKSGDISLGPQPVARQGEEAVRQKGTDNKQKYDTDALERERQFYHEEERKATDKLTLELISKEKLEGTDMMTFKFSRAGLDFLPGQFAYFQLEGVSGDPKGPTRHFSISSSPTEREYIMISTRIRDSPYKQRLASLDKGAKVVAWGPQGEFTLEKDRPAVLLSGGIGVTPFRSMLKYATDKALPAKIVLFDSNRNSGNILYRDEFDSWAKDNANLSVIYTITDENEKNSGQQWQGERGRIDRSMLKRHLTDQQLSESVYYVCGPPGMLKAMRDLLAEMQMPKDRIKDEEFTGY